MYRALGANSISGPSLFKPGIDAELILRAESHDGAPAVGAFARHDDFLQERRRLERDRRRDRNASERDAGVKRFYKVRGL